MRKKGGNRLQRAAALTPWAPAETSTELPQHDAVVPNGTGRR
jgi:hypothetical protein